MQALDDFSIAYSQMNTALPARVDPDELTAFATRADHASKSAKELALALFAFTVARGKNPVRYPLTDTGRRVWYSVRAAVSSKKHCDLGLRLRRYRDPGCRRRLVAVESLPSKWACSRFKRWQSHLLTRYRDSPANFSFSPSEWERRRPDFH